MMIVTKQNLIDLFNHYKLKADLQHELGNFEEAKAYDELAAAIDSNILDLMVREQESSVNNATIQ